VWSLKLQLAYAAVICEVCKAAMLLQLLQPRHGDSLGTKRKGTVCYWKPGSCLFIYGAVSGLADYTASKCKTGE
jgi:hypothetical protein